MVIPEFDTRLRFNHGANTPESVQLAKDQSKKYAISRMALARINTKLID
jgi:hypothetical protein